MPDMVAPAPSAPCALVLGSGGARGWCHIGVFHALDEMGLRPDLMAGCSMGAVVGAAWAAGRLAQLETLARSLSRSRVLRMLNLRPGAGGLLGPAGLGRILNDLGLNIAFEDLPLPFTAVAADLAQGQEIWLQRGALSPALQASAALPGVAPPQWIGGRWLLDGAVVNPVPVSVARAMGAAGIVAINPTARMTRLPALHAAPAPARTAEASAASRFARLIPLWSEKIPPSEPEERPPAPPPVPGYLTIASAALDIMSDRIRRSRLAGEPPDLLLNARLHDLSALDFHRAAEAIDEGYRMARAQEAALREWLTPTAAADKTPPPPTAPSAAR